MIAITSIRPTRRGRYALFGEEGFLFSVDAETLAAADLHEGSRLGEGELSCLREASDTRRAAAAALRYLSLRAYGEEELYQKLLLRTDEHSAAAAVAKMREMGLLDDAAFAAAKAKGMAERGKSPAQIRRTLYALGIEAELADAAVEALDIDGAGAALAVLRKSYAGKLRAGERDKVMAALARRGFSHRDIKRAVEAAAQELEDEA